MNVFVNLLKCNPWMWRVREISKTLGSNHISIVFKPIVRWQASIRRSCLKVKLIVGFGVWFSVTCLGYEPSIRLLYQPFPSIKLNLQRFTQCDKFKSFEGCSRMQLRRCIVLVEHTQVSVKQLYKSTLFALIFLMKIRIDFHYFVVSVLCFASILYGPVPREGVPHLMVSLQLFSTLLWWNCEKSEMAWNSLAHEILCPFFYISFVLIANFCVSRRISASAMGNFMYITWELITKVEFLGEHDLPPSYNAAMGMAQPTAPVLPSEANIQASAMNPGWNPNMVQTQPLVEQPQFVQQHFEAPPQSERFLTSWEPSIWCSNHFSCCCHQSADCFGQSTCLNGLPLLPPTDSIPHRIRAKFPYIRTVHCPLFPLVSSAIYRWHLRYESSFLILVGHAHWRLSARLAQKMRITSAQTAMDTSELTPDLVTIEIEWVDEGFQGRIDKEILKRNSNAGLKHEEGLEEYFYKPCIMILHRNFPVFHIPYFIDLIDHTSGVFLSS